MTTPASTNTTKSRNARLTKQNELLQNGQNWIKKTSYRCCKSKSKTAANRLMAPRTNKLNIPCWGHEEIR